MKKLSRVSTSEVAEMKENLISQFLSAEPVWLTQRRAFKKMMPEIYVYREIEGFSFKQITSMLTSYGLKLSVSSVQTYYGHYFEYVEKECASELEKLIQLREKIRKEFEDEELSMMVGKLTEWVERNRKGV